jgi:hypothetical protein
MAQKPISAELYTASHRILCRLNPGPSGIFSFLNIPTRSYLEVEGAHLTQLHQPGKMVARFPTLWVVKNRIVAMLLSGRVELGPTAGARGGYLTQSPTLVHILLGGYELRGSVETGGKFNFGALMFEGTSIFIPLYDAELMAILFPNVRAQSPAILFNREMVDAIGLLPKDGVSSDGVASAAS